MTTQKVYANISNAFCASIVLLFSIAGYHYQTSYPSLLVAFVFGLGGITSYFLVKFLLGHLLIIFKKIPKQFLIISLTFIFCAFILRNISFRFPEAMYYQGILLLISIFSLFFLSLHLFAERKQKVAILGLLLPLIIVGAGAWWLFTEGSDPYSDEIIADWNSLSSNSLVDQQVMNPSSIGNQNIEKFTYGSGDDFRRPEYADKVKFKSEKVDASFILPEWKGKAKKWRERYWKFGVDNFPLNGRVYMPTSGNNHPLVLIVHGNHSMIDYSDDGYGYIGEVLASKGYVVVSVDENFLNGHWSGDFRGKEMPTRAWMLLKHLQQWKAWNEDADHELFGKVDLNNVMLIGHSRGGEAVSIAGAFNQLDHYPDNGLLDFDFNFGIKSLISIAPTDYRYHREISLQNINYLSLQGSYDADEVSFWGMRPYHRLKFTDSKDWIKAGVYLHRANHGQFNSTWGRADAGAPFKWLLNTKPMVTGEDQRKAGLLFIASFADITLQGKEEYIPIFQNVAAAKPWLPENIYLTNFSVSNDIVLQDYEEDISISAGRSQVNIQTKNLKVWKEQTVLTREESSMHNNVAVLGWKYQDTLAVDSIAEYSLSNLGPIDLDTNSVYSLIVSLGTGDIKELNKSESKNDNTKPKSKFKKDDKKENSNINFTIQLTDTLGHSVDIEINQIKPLRQPIKTKFTKLKSLNKDMFGSEWEVQLESYHIPIETFEATQSNFDLSKLNEIKVIFNKSHKGVIVLDDIGLSKLKH